VSHQAQANDKDIVTGVNACSYTDASKDENDPKINARDCAKRKGLPAKWLPQVMVCGETDRRN
jgi:hypothetical protein